MNEEVFLACMEMLGATRVSGQGAICWRLGPDDENFAQAYCSYANYDDASRKAIHDTLKAAGEAEGWLRTIQ